MKSRGKAVLWALVPVLLLVPLLLWQGKSMEDDLAFQQRHDVQHSLDLHASALQRAFVRIGGKLDSLEKFVADRTTGGRAVSDEQFETFAAGLHASSSWIRAFEIVSDGIITHAYPTRGNETVLGYNLLTDSRPVIGADVIRALKQGGVTITGPVELLQGGSGIIFRKPLPVAGDGPVRLVGIVMSITPLLAGSGIGQPGDSETRLAIRQDSGEVFWGPPELFDHEPVLYRLSLADGSWEIGAEPRGGWQAAGGRLVSLFYLAGTITVLLICWLVFQIARRQADLEEALRSSHQIREGILNAIPVRVFWKDKNLVYLGCNTVFARDAGYDDAEDIIGKSDFQLGWPDQAEAYRADDRGVIEEGCVKSSIEESQTTPDGRTVTLLTSKLPLRNAEGEISGVLGTYIDISERKRSELLIRRLNRVYAMLGDVNQLMVRENDPQAIMVAACRIAVEQGGFRMAWIGMFNLATQDLQPVASSGVVDGYTDLLRINLQDATRNTGPSCRCLLSGEHVICDDIATDPGFSPWRDEALKRGYRSLASFPLKSEGSVVGVFNLYADEPGFFNEEEVRLLDELATDIAFALEVRRNETTRRLAEERNARQRKELIALTGQRSFADTDITATLRQITESAARTLDVARVSIWRYSADHTGIECADLFESETERHSSGTMLSASTHPAYFRALETADVITANDAENDPRTGEFAQDYLRPLGIKAMLDVPIHVGGELGGVLCHEHIGEPRQWTPDEETFAMALANLVALSFEGKERRDAVAAVEEGRNRHQLLFNTMLDGLALHEIICDENGAPCDYRFLEVNPAFERLTGLNAADIIGRTVLQVLPDTEPVWIQTYGQVALTGQSIRVENYSAALGKHFNVVAFSPCLNQFVTILVDVTEAKRAETELRKLSRIVEQAPLSIVITDLAGTIEYANPAFCAVTGYPLAEVLGQNPRMLNSGLTPPEVYPDMWETLIRREVWRGEFNNKKKNGELYDEFAVIAPVTGGTGKVTHYVALKQDITERKKAEIALRDSEQRFRELFDLESDAILVVEAETCRIVQANESACTAYGYTLEELLTMSTLDISAEPEKTREFLGTLSGSSDNIFKVPFRLHRRRDGTIFPVEISVRTFQRAGQFMMVSVMRDITEQVKAREQLVRFNAELEGKVALRTTEIVSRNREIEVLLQSIPDLVMRLRDDGTVLDFQPAKGATPLANVETGTHAPDVGHAFDPLVEAARPLGLRALAENTTITAEMDIELGSDPRTIELRVAPIDAREFVVFARDITERKRIEVAMMAMLEKERQVSEMKTRFISMTSHEFRTPMAAVMGSADLLHNHFDRITPAKREELFSRIDTSLHRMTEMLDDVLLLNRIDAERVEVRLCPIQLLDFVKTVVDEIQLGDHETHGLELHAEGDLSHFVTDSELLHHILSNLLSNAVRYSPAGTLVTTRITAEAERVLITVEDRGIGIPEVDRERIFESFERGSNVGVIKGTGLGLNIVKHMTALLGGTIALEVPAGGGSRFILTLPHVEPTPDTSP